MSKEKSIVEKSGKKAPQKTLKEKRADKQAKRSGRSDESKILLSSK